jgi:methyltransferase (TIGR00027 family)
MLGAKRGRIYPWIKMMVEQQGSSTAEFTCLARGLATREKDERFRGPDTMAELLFPIKAKLMLNIPVLRYILLKRMFAPGIYEYVLARTKALDEIFINAIHEGIQQIVILGAGYDTRAFRFAKLNKGTKIFEVDAPSTQELKRKQLGKANILSPKELIFIPIDFNKLTLAEALHAGGFRDGIRSLFLWEGVTMYLTAEAVDTTLAFIHTSSKSGSMVAFDYAYASVLRGENRYYGEKEIMKTVSKVGEGWTFGIEEDAATDFLSARGFQIIAELDPKYLQNKYLQAADGTIFGIINGTQSIIVAENI